MHDEMPNKVRQDQSTAASVLEMLKQGNQRQLLGQPHEYDVEGRKQCLLNDGQYPLAQVLCCIDSRVNVNAIFDVADGDLLVSRIAGNVATADIVSSLCFAATALGPKLIVVLGHSQCGAVKAKVEEAPFPHGAGAILQHVCVCDGSAEEAEKHNVQEAVRKLKAVDALCNLGVTIVGAHMNLASGEVAFL